MNQPRKGIHYIRCSLLALVMLVAGGIGTSAAQPMELPVHGDSSAVTTAGTVTSHTGFSLLYNEEHEQADWVAYELSADRTEGDEERSDDFRADDTIPTGSAALSDYRGSGYDRGHLIPAADAAWSSAAMSASFYLSNMSPQHPSFNRGGWKSLEALVRDWAAEHGKVHVVTGPALKQGIILRIGSNGVSVPHYYYKVILDNRQPDLKGIGFIMPNRKLGQPVESYAVTIDSVESFTGLDFYSSLPDSIENVLESELELTGWGFESADPPPTAEEQSDTHRCRGITQAGERCKRMTSHASGFCWQHQ